MIGVGSKTKRSATALALLVGILLVAPLATAAAPTPNGQYSGTLQQGEKELHIHVSADGKTATGTVYCSLAKSGTFPRFAIVKGAFTATDKIGGTPVAAMTGTVLSSTQLKARLNLSPNSAICDGKGGTVYLKLKTS
jgi:hypothetical protein